jgi:hypothetical protein
MKEVKDGWATSLGSLQDAKAFFGNQPFREMIRFAVLSRKARFGRATTVARPSTT